MLREKCFISVAVLLVAALTARFAQASIGGFAAAIAAEFEEMAAVMQQERNHERLISKLQDKLSNMRKQMADQATEVRNTRPKLEERMRQLDAMHQGAPMSEWAARHREEYQSLKAASEKLDPLEADIKASLADMHFLHGKLNSYTSDAFQKRFQQLKDHLAKLNRGFEEYKNNFSVETSKPGDASGSIVVRPAKHVTVINESEEMIFRIKPSASAAWTTLLPGKPTPVDFRAGEHGQIIIQAMTFDRFRKQLIAVGERFAAGEMKTARLLHKIDHYRIRYGAGSLATEIRSTGEEYGWQSGSNVSRAVGKLSPWSAADFVTPKPKIDSTREAATDVEPAVLGDVLTWWLPRVEDATVDFTFTATGHVKWVQERTLATGRTSSEDETEVTSGSLTIRVSPR